MINEINEMKTAKDYVQVGDILYTSWGYDQTNTEYFKVIAISKRYMKMVELEADYKETGFMSGISKPSTEIKEEKIVKGYVSPDGHMNVSEKGYKRSLWIHKEGKEHYTSSYA